MPAPLKHHYLPEFYLRRWAISSVDGRVVAFRRVPRSRALDVKRFFPGGTGYLDGLYSVPSRTDAASRQAIESDFMSPLDSDAALALTEMETTGEKPLNEKLVSAWTRFLLSMWVRNPLQVAWIRRKLEEDDQSVMARIEASYDQMRGPEDPATFAEFRATASAAHIDEHCAFLLTGLIDSRFLGEHVARMAWRVFELDRPEHGFLTGDVPMMASDGIGRKYGFMALPIGPDRLFFAANDDRVITSFTDQPQALENAFNDAVARQARELVISRTTAHRAFVEERIGTSDHKKMGGFLERQAWIAPLRDA